MPAGSPLMAFAQTTLSTRTVQRVLVSGAEGTGRTFALTQPAGLPLLRVDVSAGPVMPQTLRALLPHVVDDEARWNLLKLAPELASLEPARSKVAIELLGSLLGVRSETFHTAKLDEESRREGATLELARWLSERAAHRGLLLAFDDAHLADDDGIAFIEMLSQRDEAVPLCLVVAYDTDPARFSAAFRTKKDTWLQDARWARHEVTGLDAAVLRQVLTEAGASATQVEALVRAASGNPALGLGLLSLWNSNPSLAAGDLPRTHDALRVARVRALPTNVTRAVSSLAVLGGRAPLAALSAVDPTVPMGLHQAVVADVVRFERQGPLEVCRFVDPRIAKSLERTVAASETLGSALTAGAWAAQALDELDPALFSRVAEVLVPLAKPALEGTLASFWFEAWAYTNPGRPDSVARLEQAAAGAQGIRRLVLLRRIAEAKLFLGLPDEALSLVQSAGRPGSAAAQALPTSNVGRVLAYQHRGLLDQWHRLTADEAMAALELVRAEVLSNLVKKEDTQKAFGELEKRLSRLDGPVAHHLWVRWAKAWSWFLCEILGQAREAMRVCGVVRARVPAALLSADEDAIAFVRAEEIATAGSGNLTRARALTEEHIALSERSARLRDACLAWNARAIVHYGEGELALAKKGFERAIELARTTGWLRREAISLHNLSLVLSELGDFDEAHARETLYAKLSLLIGNHAAKAEAPAVLAGLELGRGRLVEAEAHITTVRKVAEANSWDMLSAISRALSGRLRLQRFRAGGDSLDLTRARNDLLAALAVLEEQQVAWSEELDPAEVYGLLAAAMKFSGQVPNAKRLLENAATVLPADNVVSQQQVRVAVAWLGGANVDHAVGWFEQAGFARRVALWRSLW